MNSTAAAWLIRRLRRLAAGGLACLAALAIAVGPAHAEDESNVDDKPRVDVFLSVGAEAWPAPEQGGHGWLLAAVTIDELPGDGRFAATFNTETLSLSYTDLRPSDALRAGFRLKGELGYAQLMPDYYRRGLLVPSRGFTASYVEAHAHTKWLFAPHQSLEVHIDGRRWFFGRTDDTSDGFVLPPDHYTATSALRYVYWDLANDPSISHAHRPFWRVRGAAFGLTLETAYRTDASAWGARSDEFTPRDLRNDPATQSVSLTQWFRAGKQVTPAARFEFSEWAAWSDGVDDLDRGMLGGMNPFVVPVAGLPWASLITGRYLVVQPSLHYRLWREIEAGVLVDIAGVSDIRRAGELDEFGAAAGFGGFVDARLGSWQADLRVGWSPDFNWQSAGPHVGVMVAVGKRF